MCTVHTGLGYMRDINLSQDEDIAVPDLYLHAVRGNFPIDRGMQILCRGLEHSDRHPHGVYSVSAAATNVTQKLSSYDCGVATLSSHIMRTVSLSLVH